MRVVTTSMPLAVAVGDDRGPELLVWGRAPAEHLGERVRERDRVSLDCDVDVEALLSEQYVSDRAADKVDAVRAVPERRDRVDNRTQPRGRPQVLGDAREPPPTV